MKSVFAKSTVALCLGLLIGLAFQVTFTKFTEPALATVSLNPVTLEVLGNPFAQTPLSTTLKAEAISFALPRTVIGSVQQNGNQIVMMPMLI
ncbi:MAG: hypothetical protein Q8P95_04540, partial [bacterium]|nr:hypothetical protein [bacterium]